MANRLASTVLLLFAIAVLLSAQQVGTDRKLLEETKTRAEKGDAEAQFKLAVCYATGDAVAKDSVEAAKWFRKAAEQGHLQAQCNLGWCYHEGNGVPRDYAQAVKWYQKAADKDYAHGQLLLGMAYATGQGVPLDYRAAFEWYKKAADQNDSSAQLNVASCYLEGKGVEKDESEAVRWCQKAAGKGVAAAESALGACYLAGRGVPQDYALGVKWLRKAAEKGDATGMTGLGVAYFIGQGVPEDYVEAYKWLNLGVSQGVTNATTVRDQLRSLLTPEQIAEGQRRASAFRARVASETTSEFISGAELIDFAPDYSGTGFFITEDGFLITNGHVVKDALKIRLVSAAGLIPARIVMIDEANDLALLKGDGSFKALPIASSRSVKMGNTVATVGFPNVGLQGFAPKLAKGEIGALSGAKDDPKYFQISVPLQPGNSGGALVDEHGNVVGVVSSKLNASVTLATSGALPENVNYAIKSSLLLSFLESVPELSAKLKEPGTKAQSFEDVVSSAERAAVIVLCQRPQTSAPFFKVQVVPVNLGVSSGHSVESVLDDGNFIKLDDGTLWQVAPFDAGDCSSWSESSEITIIKVDDSAYPYKLINTDDNESILARLVRN